MIPKITGQQECIQPIVASCKIRFFEKSNIRQVYTLLIVDAVIIFAMLAFNYVTSSRMVNDILPGEYHSTFKGRGIEFDTVREYQPGDEIRTIDWNVTARTGKPYIKQFVEERELTVMLLVDVSASGQFGSIKELKNEFAAELCAVLAFSAIKNNDKVGLIMFTDQVEKYIPPKKGKSHVLRVISEILSFKPERKGTNIEEALSIAFRMI